MRAGSENPNKENMSGELDAEESASGVGQDQGDKVLFGEFKWMIRSCTSESAMETCSTADSSVNSSSAIRNYYVFRQELERGIRFVKFGNPHVTGRDMSKRFRQVSVSTP